MKYSPHDYSKAFVKALSEAPRNQEQTLCRRLVAMVIKNGDRQGLNKIAEKVEMLLVRKKGWHVITVESARPLSAKSRKELLSRFRASDIVREEISPELVAGARLTWDGERELDLSFTGVIKRILA